MTRRRWVVAIVAVLLVAALIVLYSLGLLGNTAIAAPAPASRWLSSGAFTLTSGQGFQISYASSPSASHLSVRRNWHTGFEGSVEIGSRPQHQR